MNQTMNLQLFATNTTGNLSPEMQIYYSDYLVDNTKPKLVHEQFGQKQPIPANGGKIIEFRRFSPLPKAMTPLTEGVTPDGSILSVTTVQSEIKQYGNYIELSDMVMETTVDSNVVQATKLLGNQAGETLDSVVREIINAGTNVQYGQGQVTARHMLKGGEATDNHYLTVAAIKMAARNLKRMKAEKVDDCYVAIIHPDIAFDLTNDPKWEAVKQYDPKDLYAGEIGRIGGVRFVETTEAKVFSALPLTVSAKNLTVKTAATSSTAIAVREAITAAEATSLRGRKILVGNMVCEVASATAGGEGAAMLTLKQAVTTTADQVVYGGEGGAKGRDVYSTLILGANAYGVTEVEGGGLAHILKPLGTGGTTDPLNQRATAGWKATRTAEILVDAFMLRVETCASY